MENKLQFVLQELEGVGIEENISGQHQMWNFTEQVTRTFQLATGNAHYL